MNKTASRKPLHDPYDALSDDEFEREILDALDQATVKISLRVPKKLLERTKTAANRRGVPYQSLIKALIDQGVQRLERRAAPDDALRNRFSGALPARRLPEEETSPAE
jgi:predicted DNA binding CopG/RHH family protein